MVPAGIFRTLAISIWAGDWQKWLLGVGVAWVIALSSPDALAWDNGIAIVVHVESPLTAVTTDELVNLYLGRSRQVANGAAVVPLDQLEGSAARADFYARVMNKTEAQMNSYWSRLIFSGKGRPPYAVADDQEVLELIASNRNMLGYVQSSSVTPLVKVILMVPEQQP